MDRIIEVKVYGNHLTKDSKTAGVRGEANITKLRIAFDDGWDKYEKDIVFWDAYGDNPVRIILTTDLLEDIKESVRVYLVPIPAEPMARVGDMTFTVYGSLDNKKQASATARLEVKSSPDILQPVDPTPSELQQIQAQFEDTKGKMQDAVIATDKINNMTVSAETLPTGVDATVDKSEQNGVTNLHFGLPRGERGESGVYIGDAEPTDPDVNVWIDPNGTETAKTAGGSVVTSVKMFGAIGDGVANDTAAIKRAARCGRTIYFPAGTYLLYEQIDMSADISWIGEGEKSVIKLVPAEQTRPGEENGKTVYNCNMINHYSVHNYSLSLQGMVLDANKDGYTSDVLNNGSSSADHTACIFLDSPASVYLHNVKLVGGLDCGCYIRGKETTQVSISNCRFSDNGVEGKGNGLHIESVGKGAIVSSCVIESNNQIGLFVYANNRTSASNIVCRHNGTGVCLWGGSEGTTISGLITEGNENGMLIGDCDKTMISGWNSIGDSYRYRADYYYMTKEVKGTVIGTSDTKNLVELGKTEDNKDIFKINFIGG